MKKDAEFPERSNATRAVHGRELSHDHPLGAVIPPVYHSSTYAFSTFAEMREYALGRKADSFFYSRYANPTVDEAERRLAELEGGESAVVTSSGSAATFAAIAAFCRAGDEVIACDSIYGGTTGMLNSLFSGFGVNVTYISIEEIANLEKYCTDNTRLFWFESPANPINRIVDLELVAKKCRETNVLSMIDSTFATPILQQPLKFGIDIVMHSATKYLGGHSDLTAGALVGRRELIDRARKISMMVGSTLDPNAAFLLNRGMRTLDLRVRAASHNAQRLAEALVSHPNVKRVYYPGLAGSPDHETAQRCMDGFGAIVAIELDGGENEAERFFDNLRLVTCAPSLGGVDSLVSYPLYSSHVGYTSEQLDRAGVSAATVRIAVGIEGADDLIADVTSALNDIRE